MAEYTAAAAINTVTCKCGKQRSTCMTQQLSSFPSQRIVPVVQTASVLDSSVLRDAVPVCAGDVMGASVAMVMTVDVAKVAVKQLSARNAVS